MVLSLRGAPGLTATLLHEEDDVADRRYYFATDGGNNSPLDRVNRNHPAFIIRAEGVKGSPIKAFSNFKVMVVK